MKMRVIIPLLAILGIIFISTTEFGCRKPEIKKTYIVGIVNLTGGLEVVVIPVKVAGDWLIAGPAGNAKVQGEGCGLGGIDL